MPRGRRKGSKLSEETKRKISESTKGKPKEYVSDVMHREWDDPDKREARIEHMNEAADRRRIHTDITAHQLESPEARREYMRCYQRKYRQRNPNYYKKYYTKNKAEYDEAIKNGFTGTFKEWREQNG